MKYFQRIGLIIRLEHFFDNWKKKLWNIPRIKKKGKTILKK